MHSLMHAHSTLLQCGESLQAHARLSPTTISDNHGSSQGTPHSVLGPVPILPERCFLLTSLAEHRLSAFASAPNNPPTHAPIVQRLPVSQRAKPYRAQSVAPSTSSTSTPKPQHKPPFSSSFSSSIFPPQGNQHSLRSPPRLAKKHPIPLVRAPYSKTSQKSWSPPLSKLPARAARSRRSPSSSPTYCSARV